MSLLTHCLVALSLAARAAAPAPRPKNEVKAAFLFNFTKFVDWPVSAFPSRGLFVMCVMNNAGLEDALRDTVAGETAKGRRIAIRSVGRLEQLRACHLVYVSSSESDRLRMILGQTGGAPILTVSETTGFLELGGIINFEPRDSRLGFAINKAAADKAGLNVSPQLLSLAVNVRTE